MYKSAPGLHGLVRAPRQNGPFPNIHVASTNIHTICPHGAASACVGRQRGASRRCWAPSACCRWDCWSGGGDRHCQPHGGGGGRKRRACGARHPRPSRTCGTPRAFAGREGAGVGFRWVGLVSWRSGRWPPRGGSGGREACPLCRGASSPACVV